MVFLAAAFRQAALLASSGSSTRMARLAMITFSSSSSSLSSRFSSTTTTTSSTSSSTKRSAINPAFRWSEPGQPGSATKLVAGPFQTAAQMEVDPNLPFEPVEAARPYHPCSVFFDRTLSKFINEGTRRGEKALMRELMRDTFAIIKRTQLAKLHRLDSTSNSSSSSSSNSMVEEVECDPLAIFHGALENIRPLMVTRPVKRGGATYQVPFPLSAWEAEKFAFRWLLDCIKERPKPRKTHFPEVMARELVDCFYGEGKVVKRKQDMHRQCEANKAYAHYRWN